MFEWIVETAMQEALETPHPGNVINFSDQTFTDQHGRTTKKGQFNMLFTYTSGEEHDYHLVHFWSVHFD
eukprot:237665-Amphidinium_carterae.1